MGEIENHDNIYPKTTKTLSHSKKHRLRNPTRRKQTLHRPKSQRKHLKTLSTIRLHKTHRKQWQIHILRRKRSNNTTHSNITRMTARTRLRLCKQCKEPCWGRICRECFCKGKYRKVSPSKQGKKKRYI